MEFDKMETLMIKKNSKNKEKDSKVLPMEICTLEIMRIMLLKSMENITGIVEPITEDSSCQGKDMEQENGTC